MLQWFNFQFYLTLFQTRHLHSLQNDKIQPQQNNIYFIPPCCLLYLRLSVSADVGFASRVTSASDGKWQIPETASSTEEIVKGSIKLGVPSSKIKINKQNLTQI